MELHCLWRTNPLHTHKQGLYARSSSGPSVANVSVSFRVCFPSSFMDILLVCPQRSSRRVRIRAVCDLCDVCHHLPLSALCNLPQRGSITFVLIVNVFKLCSYCIECSLCFLIASVSAKQTNNPSEQFYCAVHSQLRLCVFLSCL